MAILKCKMCGGNLEFEQGMTVCICEYCGTKQTLPRIDDDRKANLYDRASHFRRNNDFDKAMAIYEQLLEEDTTDSESYWSIVLCRYGIEYVEDPASHKRIPTVNRVQYTPVVADEDYKKALEYADVEQKIIYEEEAKKIDEIQKGILEISRKEEPFDIFICYKETDNNGSRTPDSVIGYDLYKELTNEGYKVFFSRVTLEDKLGTAYEPYIFAALNSAKVMVVLGTKPEYINAPWVKNEWSRYLALIKKGDKKTLIPAYKGMDPYDLPDEFSHLQGQDMDKIGAMQDIVRGIEKIAPLKKKDNVQSGPTIGSFYSPGLIAVLKRGNIALEDHDWDKAFGFYEEALYQDAECAEAYLGQFLARQKISSFEVFSKQIMSKQYTPKSENLSAGTADTSHMKMMGDKYSINRYLDPKDIEHKYDYDFSFTSVASGWISIKNAIMKDIDSDKLLSRARRYASGETKEILDKAIIDIESYFDKKISDAKTEDYQKVATIRNSYKKCVEQADSAVSAMYKSACDKRENDYNSAVAAFEKGQNDSVYISLADTFSQFGKYRDAELYVSKCIERTREIKAQRAAEIAAAKLEAEKQARRKKRRAIISISLFVVIIVGTLCFVYIIHPLIRYNNALKLVENGQYREAALGFDELGSYRDSQLCAKVSRYNYAFQLMDSRQYDEAIIVFQLLDHYQDSDDQITRCNYLKACDLEDSGDFVGAKVIFANLGDYEDSQSHLYECEIMVISQFLSNEQYRQAIAQYDQSSKSERVSQFVYDAAIELIDNNQIGYGIQLLDALGDYEDSRSVLNTTVLSHREYLEEGMIVSFGALYGEPIDWFVISTEPDRVLLMSCYALAQSRFDDDSNDWQSSEIRALLNGEFYNGSFSESERSLIISGNDNVFLLDYDEFYELTNDLRVCMDEDGNSYIWWLRSPGESSDYAASVDNEGDAEGFGSCVSYSNAVRPAIWLNLGS